MADLITGVVREVADRKRYNKPHGWRDWRRRGAHHCTAQDTTKVSQPKPRPSRTVGLCSPSENGHMVYDIVHKEQEKSYNLVASVIVIFYFSLHPLQNQAVGDEEGPDELVGAGLESGQ